MVGRFRYRIILQLFFLCGRQVYDADSYMRYYPNFLYSVTPLVGKTLYGFLAKALNDYEEHLTAAKKKNMLVLKVRYILIS